MLGSLAVFAFPVAQTPKLLVLTNTVIIWALSFGGAVFFFTFPTGRFTPRWTFILFSIFLVCTLPFAPPVVSVLALPLVLGEQAYRYTRVYDAVQRQQAKWYIFGFGVCAAMLTAYYSIGALIPGLSSPDSWYQLFNPFMWLSLWLLLLLSIGIAILRYRLWDIDLLINRTLVYSALTTLLATVYASLILVSQALTRAVTGSQTQPVWAIVGSTLVIVALFQPLRRRIQTTIDRRFYRRKYDAAAVIADFSASLRTEVDVDALREQLLATLQETMAPVHVSLWIRPLIRKRNDGAPS